MPRWIRKITESAVSGFNINSHPTSSHVFDCFVQEINTPQLNYIHRLKRFIEPKIEAFVFKYLCVAVKVGCDIEGALLKG
jgi:hypothetical protein